ncbi:hypothetical protein GCM10027589_26820 [Actinocorallia lasiicapitis]
MSACPTSQSDIHKITLTDKQQDADAANAIERIRESEITVSDFDGAKRLLEAAGFTVRNYREEWRLDRVVFDLNTWPDFPAFLEIEGLDEPAVRAAADLLSLDLRQRRRALPPPPVPRHPLRTDPPVPLIRAVRPGGGRGGSGWRGCGGG